MTCAKINDETFTWCPPLDANIHPGERRGVTQPSDTAESSARTRDTFCLDRSSHLFFGCRLPCCLTWIVEPNL